MKINDETWHFWNLFLDKCSKLFSKEWKWVKEVSTSNIQDPINSCIRKKEMKINDEICHFWKLFSDKCSKVHLFKIMKNLRQTQTVQLAFLEILKIMNKFKKKCDFP
jgi:hypothetical protein